MYSVTSQKIIEFITKHQGSSAKDIIVYFKLNSTGVFRHLKKMQKKKILYKVGKPPKVRYYAYTHPMEEKSKLVANALNWAVSGDAHLQIDGQFCQTRDDFQARNDRLLNDLKRIIKNDDLIYLIVAAVGEIGNNSFDHNLGKWRDVPGVFFSLDIGARIIVIADRGQGIFATIKRVKPNVLDTAEALYVAFTEMVSGRAPEQRGNGLKFVKKIIEDNHLCLIFYTGDAMVEITAQDMKITKSAQIIPGTFGYLTF